MKSAFAQIHDEGILGDAVDSARADAADLTGADEGVSRILADGQDFGQLLHMEYQRKILKRSDGCHIRILLRHRTSMPGTPFRPG